MRYGRSPAPPRLCAIDLPPRLRRAGTAPPHASPPAAAAAAAAAATTRPLAEPCRGGFQSSSRRRPRNRRLRQAFACRRFTGGCRMALLSQGGYPKAPLLSPRARSHHRATARPRQVETAATVATARCLGSRRDTTRRAKASTPPTATRASERESRRGTAPAAAAAAAAAHVSAHAAATVVSRAAQHTLRARSVRVRGRPAHSTRHLRAGEGRMPRSAV